jgi:cyclophilin family peptidyl-prolyl cis-trans isomerase
MNVTTLLVTALCVAGLLAASCSAADANRPQASTQPSSAPAAGAGGNPVVIIETSMGTIKAELWADKAPLTVANFLRYTDEKFYDGLIFHRVIPNFMIQGGGFLPGMKQRDTHEAIKNEASPKLRNDRGTLAMARTSDVDSATGQFFINLKDNDFLNQTSRRPDGFGYCAFGKVLEGLDVVDKIAKVKTGTAAGGHQDVPTETVEIKSIRRAP